MTRGIRLVALFLAVLVASCGEPVAPSTPAPTQPTPTPTQPSAPGTPVPIAPKDNSYVSLRPTFIVLNASHQSGLALQYAFTIATDAAFVNVIAKGSIPEGVDQTSFTPSFDLPAMTTIFWRAQAFNDSTNDLRSGFATGTFVTPFVGPARLTISTSLPCNSFMTDLLVDGTASASDSGLVFHTTRSDVTVMATGGGTAVGDARSVGQGARCYPGDYPGMYVDLQYEPGVTVSDLSFATPGHITGSLAGGIRTWNVFSDGGTLQRRTYSFSIVPR